MLDIKPYPIEEGELADLTIFDFNKKWIFDSKSNLSKSKNTPFFGKEFSFGVLGTINKGKLALTE